MKRNLDILDLTKFILALFVVATHTKLLQGVLMPWLRLAVPLFFIISSFLLFSKLNEAQEDDKWKIIRKSCIRIMKLYLFWFIILLPYTLFIRKSWFDAGAVTGCLTMIKHILFGSTFPVSWYLAATVEATLILGLISIKCKKKSFGFFMALFSLLYCICCLRSSYFPFFSGNEGLSHAVSSYERVIGNPVFGFPVALFWMSIGKLFAENRFSFSRRISAAGTLLSAILLFVEWHLIRQHTGAVDNDCYLFLAPLAIFLFALIKDIRITVPHAKNMRKISTITFCSHLPVVSLLGFAADHFQTEQSTAVSFLTTVAVCMVICIAIIVLESKKGLGFLRFSH